MKLNKHNFLICIEECLTFLLPDWYVVQSDNIKQAK